MKKKLLMKILKMYRQKFHWIKKNKKKIMIYKMIFSKK